MIGEPVHRSVNLTIVACLKDMGIDATVVPPYEAAVPQWGRWVEFGETDEGVYPYRLDLTDRVCEVSDHVGDPILLASIERTQLVATSVHCCIITMNTHGNSGKPDYLVPTRMLPDGRVLDVAPLLFGAARLTVSKNATTQIIGDAWEYENPVVAIGAWAQWDGEGEPEGWTRHPATGRRRPNGDPEREQVRE